MIQSTQGESYNTYTNMLRRTKTNNCATQTKKRLVSQANFLANQTDNTQDKLIAQTSWDSKFNMMWLNFCKH